jgi:hypothetical protein
LAEGSWLVKEQAMGNEDKQSAVSDQNSAINDQHSAISL